jgi:hypothetical protein
VACEEGQVLDFQHRGGSNVFAMGDGAVLKMLEGCFLVSIFHDEVMTLKVRSKVLE